MTSTTRQQRKAIPTFTWLMRKAEVLRRKKPEEYEKLVESSTTEMLKGIKVSMLRQKNEGYDAFALHKITKGGSRLYAYVKGFKDGDDFYTLFVPKFSATEYSKRMHKFLPFDLPDGSLSGCGNNYRASKPCILYNADGSVLTTESRWHGGRRGRSGYVQHERDGVYLVIRDKDGAFVGISQYFNQIAYMDEYYFSNPIDIQHGFLPGTVTSKIQWYDSMNCGSDGELWSERKMKTMAARVHAEAIALSKKYPHIKVALYPMERAPDWNKDSHNRCVQPRRFGEVERKAVVVGRDSFDRPVRYYLPEIVAYWTIPFSTERGRGLRFIRATVPPVGCKSLLRDSFNSSCFTAIHDLPKNVEVAGDYHSMAIHREQRGLRPEQAYHSHELICLAIGNWGKYSIGYSRSSFLKHGDCDSDKVVHDWNKDQNVVVVQNYSADEPDDDPKYDQQYAARPSGVFSCIEEKELMDSLPLV